MKTTNYSLFTSKNISLDKNSNLIYNLMIKGGLIRKLSSGIYIWLPNGIKIINNIINIIKKYFNNINAIEINMPVIQPSYIWRKSNRLVEYGKELFKFYDRNNKLFIISPTQEEVITQLICNENLSLNFFPKIFYQIQKKFRDEIRPKLGILRSREFFMKDAYSFHNSLNSLNKCYLKIFEIYKCIFKEIGLNFFYKKADCGNIKGILSHEFHVFSKYGEDKNKININRKYFSYSYYFNKINKCNFINYRNKNFEILKLLNIKKLNSLIKLRNFIKIRKFVKTYLVECIDNIKTFFLFVLVPLNKKIDLHKLYYIYPFVHKIIVWKKKKIEFKYKFKSLFLGPFLNYKIISDYSLITTKNFSIGSNRKNYFYINVNWYININVSGFYDICKNFCFNLNNIKNNNNIKKFTSSEIAHIFKLGDYYSSIFINKNRINKNIFMGCYGIGINRIISCLIEQYNDHNGIIWPLSVSNFKLGILPINMYKFDLVYEISMKIYNFLISNNIEVLLDDRKLYIGEMITDLNLLGIPNLLILSNKMLKLGLVEFQDRLNKIKKFFYVDDILNYLLLKYK